MIDDPIERVLAALEAHGCGGEGTMASEPIAIVLDALERAGSRGTMTAPGTRWQYQCPAHEDRKPSLSVPQNQDGTVSLHCQVYPSDDFPQTTAQHRRKP
jgi:hypothetical protein